MPTDITFSSGVPPAPFGTREHFDFCERVPLKHDFTVAQWENRHDNQTKHLGYLLRHGVPLIWRNGAKFCQRLKVPKVDKEQGFVTEVKRLLRPANLVDPDGEIEVKSAKIGEVNISNQFLKHFRMCS